MKNILKIDDYSAVIEFDPEINQFRGEFIGLNGGADFYGTSTKEAQPGPGKNGGKKRSVHGVHAYFFTIFNAAIFIKAWASAVVFQQAVREPLIKSVRGEPVEPQTLKTPVISDVFSALLQI